METLFWVIGTVVVGAILYVAYFIKISLRG
jgi:hypothetical protein